ncbi:MAG: hypothetical protein CL693_03595 [Cellvibrionaceae bacterium]|nr:hypothetical protein [Cellvibrionaceae bacterium]|tara:strand:+ start:11669 stop:12682 length:1014 start_codon:yes stop_codon:yes gene_type:complete
MRIAVDWGSTHFRAMRVNDSGQVIDRVKSEQGVLSRSMQDDRGYQDNQRFAQVIEQHCHAWLSDTPSASCFLGGMIGSRSGWQEVPYLDSTQWLSELSQQLQAAPDSSHFLIAGVRQQHKGHWDVMRGEETQILGAAQMLADDDAANNTLMLLPGTHCKWAAVSTKKANTDPSIIDARIDHFTTFMTGELYQWAHQHSSLSGLMTEDVESFDLTAFTAGVEQGRNSLALSQLLFSIRADKLMDTLPGHSCGDYLSGLLIGHEITSALTENKFEQKNRRKHLGDVDLVIVGSDALASRYQQALQLCGRDSRMIDAESAYCQGVLTIDRLRTIPPLNLS